MINAKRQLKKSGYVVLRSVIKADRARFWDSKFEGALPVWADECGTSLEKYLSSVCRWRRPNPLVSAMSEELGADMRPQIQEVLGLPVSLSGAGIFRKSEFACMGTHAHQDASYRWRAEDADKGQLNASELWAEKGECEALSSWVALSDAPAGQGALQVLPESHTAPISVRQDFLDPDFVDVASTPFWDNAVSLPMNAGDVVLFDSRLWHSAPPSGDARRTALALRWETNIPMEAPPLPKIDPSKYGMDTSGVHIKASLIFLLQKNSSASKESLEILVAEARMHDVLKKLPSPGEADKYLERYMVLRKAGGLHFATAQNNMVWEPLYHELVQPVEAEAKQEMAALRL